jgi:hypothetical protein
MIRLKTLHHTQDEITPITSHIMNHLHGNIDDDDYLIITDKLLQIFLYTIIVFFNNTMRQISFIISKITI